MAPGLSASATLKLVLLLASGISHHIVVTSLNPPAEKLARPNFFEKNVHAIFRIVIVSHVSSRVYRKTALLNSFAYDRQYPFWLAIILDIAATGLTAFSGLVPVLTSASALSHLTSILVPPHFDAQVLQRPSTPCMLSAVFLVAFASLRAWCYKTLGHHFRFEVSIQARHKLITSGPYRIVRHPSYLAGYGYFVGSIVLLATRGTYMRERVLAPLLRAVLCAATSSERKGCVVGVGKLHAAALMALIALGMWFAGMVFCVHQVFGRLSWEEKVLHKEFGKSARHMPSVCAGASSLGCCSFEFRLPNPRVLNDPLLVSLRSSLLNV